MAFLFVLTLIGDDILIPTGGWLAGIYADGGVLWHGQSFSPAWCFCR